MVMALGQRQRHAVSPAGMPDLRPETTAVAHPHLLPDDAALTHGHVVQSAGNRRSDDRAFPVRSRPAIDYSREGEPLQRDAAAGMDQRRGLRSRIRWLAHTFDDR